jgi:hypothetical protein
VHQCCLLHFICINKHDLYCSKFVLITTRLFAILNVMNNKCCGTFQARSWIIFHLQGKPSHTRLACEVSTHRRRNIHNYLLYTDWSIKRYKRTIWLFIVEVYPVWYSKQRIYFITGSFDFPNIIRQLCVNNSAINFDCESTGLKPVMDFKIPFIYIAETQRSRTIMSKYSYLLQYHTNARTPPCGTTWIFRTIYAPDTGIVLYS